MKTNPNDPTNPITVYFEETGKQELGLTKREYFAAMAMQGMCANPNLHNTYFQTALYAIKQADALIVELNK